MVDDSGSSNKDVKMLIASGVDPGEDMMDGSMASKVTDGCP